MARELVQRPHTDRSHLLKQFMLAAFALVIVFVLTAQNARAAGGTLGVGDADSVTPADMRANYGKRYPFAAAAAKEDVVQNGQSQEGQSKTFKSYVKVKQPCSGGFLNDINKLVDAIKDEAQKLKDKLVDKIKGAISPGEKACLQGAVNQLDQQLGVINSLNRNDLGSQITQLSQFQQFQSDCPELTLDPNAINLKLQESALGGLVSELGSLGDFNVPGLGGGSKGQLDAQDKGGISTETDNHDCVFHDPFCVTRKPPLPNHYYYIQQQQQSNVQLPTKRDGELADTGLMKTFGLPLSDSQFQLIERENKQRLLELMFDPERWMWAETASTDLQMGSLSNSMAGAAETSFEGALPQMMGTLTNIANDDQAFRPTAGKGKQDSGTVKAIQTVQKMFKFVFLPMSVLLLVPGALLTQFKGMVGSSILGDSTDASSPFEGILRAVIAIFLIPTTQLIISYCIDIGNSMTFSVADPAKNFIQTDLLMTWAKEQTFQPPPQNVLNGILPSAGGGGGGGQGQNKGGVGQGNGGASGGGNGGGGFSGQGSNPNAFGNAQGSNPGFGNGVGSNSGFGNAVGSNPGLFTGNGTPGSQTIADLLNSILGKLGGGGGGTGKSAGQLEAAVTQENQLFLSTALQLTFNTTGYMLTQSLIVLTAYQLVLMCYLMLLGPIAACFFAWPAGVGELFRKVFSNWLNAVVVLSLWRFYWCVILAVMTQRLILLRPNPGDSLEMITFNCFLALLVYIPFHPFNFNPGDVAADLLQQAGK